MPTTFTEKDFKTLPWKNGGGVTQELYKLPHPQDPERFLFRLSIATLSQSGPFSLFPNIDRHLLLLQGRGIVINDRTLDKLFEPIQFRGEEAIESRLIDGPCIDFNVMVDRSWGKVDVVVMNLESHQELAFTQGKWNFFYAVEQKKLFETKDENLSFVSDIETKMIIVSLSS